MAASSSPAEFGFTKGISEKCSRDTCGKGCKPPGMAHGEVCWIREVFVQGKKLSNMGGAGDFIIGQLLKGTIVLLHLKKKKKKKTRRTKLTQKS